MCIIFLAEHVLTKLEKGSLVQFGSPVQYGVIIRIETAVDTLEEIAEVETVSSYIDINNVYTYICS